MIRALIFDFDGLIVDTETPEYDSWAAVYQAHGHDLPLELWTANIGLRWGSFDPYAHLEHLVGHPLAHEAIRAERRARFMDAVARQPVMAGVEAYLTDGQRRGLRLAVASSSPRHWVEPHLERLGLLPYFPVVKCAEDVADTKPAPDLYLAAAAALGVSPAEAVAFEDSPNGIAAAVRAGLFCVAVPTPLTRTLVLGQAHLTVPSLDAMSLAEVLAAATPEHPQKPAL